MATIIPELVKACTSEWEFFRHSRKMLNGTSVVGLKEYEDGGWQRVGDYWKFIGGAYKNLTGKDRGEPWSAAFVSWCMHEAGAGLRFPYSPRHATYINASIKDAQVAGAPLVGKKLKGYKLKVGDLIGYWRGGTKITFENALKVEKYESHTDVIVEVANGKAYSIGGNVLHSVTRREVKLGRNGDLEDTSENWFIALQNNL